jgi:ATP-dependent RNA helicase HelY
VLLGRNDEMTAGDFVRNIKQLTDLLGQLAANATDPATAGAARHAGDAIHRGVVALSGSVQAP